MGRSDRRFVALAVALATAALACNAIVGLSDYERGECSGGGVCADAGAPDAPADAPTDVVERVDASGSRPVSWAHFKMPNYPQDGGPTENVISAATYRPTTGGFVDTITDLVWREPLPKDDQGLKTWEEAQRICARMTEGGTWRLPSRIELVTLLDLSRSPKIAAPFESTQPLQYWTTSEVRLFGVNGNREHWTVDFSSGGLNKQDKSGGTAAVRCILDQKK